jgi:hypothetical protein
MMCFNRGSCVCVFLKCELFTNVCVCVCVCVFKSRLDSTCLGLQMYFKRNTANNDYLFTSQINTIYESCFL